MVLFSSKILFALLILVVSVFFVSFVYVRFTGYDILGGDAIGGSVHLSWSDGSSNEYGFRIERSDSTPSSFVEIDVAGADVELYIDSAVTEGTTYFYRIRAYNSNGNSSYSNVINITVPLSGSTSSGGGGGGSGGGSGGSSSGGGITGGAVLGNDSLGQGSQSSGEPSGEPSSSNSNSQNSGTRTISGRAIGEDFSLGKISLFGIIAIAGVLIAFVLYKIFHRSQATAGATEKV